MADIFDVAIVGSGPAGMFCALEIAEKTGSKGGAGVVLLEKGQIRSFGNTSSSTCGFGGAGAFSDGKLNLTSKSGGQLADFLGKDEFRILTDYIDRRYVGFRQGDSSLYGENIHTDERIAAISRKAQAVGLKLIPFTVRHFGTDGAYHVVENMRLYLLDLGVEIKTEWEVNEVEKNGKGFLLSGPKGKIFAKFVVLAPGRYGAEWFVSQAKKLGLVLRNNGIDIGVRVEVPYEILQGLTSVLYDVKFFFRSLTFDDRLRTFCMCPRGFVALENYHDLTTVNGHSYKDQKSDNTNFAILVTFYFTDPFHDPLRYGRNISELANLLGSPVVVQRLGDLRGGRRSTPKRLFYSRDFVEPTLKEATPGDLSLILPYRILKDILEMLEALDTVAPGINSMHTLLYGVEVKFYSQQPETRLNFETQIDNLFCAGDGCGFTRGLMQASMQGVVVGREIARRLVK